MGMIEVNNEIILMRPVVRQSRVRTVHKLTREINLLRKRHGDEKQREKYNKKADKLLNEILALKKVKDDDISIFGITNSKTLQEVLADKSLPPRTCILTRIAYYKIMKEKIEAFKNKFPDYDQYLNSKKKKSKKRKTSNKNNMLLSKDSKKKEDSTNSNAQVQNNALDFNKCNENISDDNDNEIEQDNVSENNEENFLVSDEDDFTLHNLKPGSLLRIKPASDELTFHENKSNTTNKTAVNSKNKTTKDKSQQVKNNKQKEKIQKNILVAEKAAEPVNVVSKEATVKRFTEILQEQSTEINRSLPGSTESKSIDSTAVVSKEADDFFMTGDGNDTYLSVSVPKTNQKHVHVDDDDLDNSYRKQKYLKDERFFSKIGKSSVSMGRIKRGAEHQEEKISKKPVPFDRKDGKFDSEKKGKNFNKFRSGLKSADKNDATITENLHPSWAAKKKQQEMIKQGFQGKKIVFDDV